MSVLKNYYENYEVKRSMAKWNNLKDIFSGYRYDDMKAAQEYVEFYHDDAEKMLLEHGKYSAVEYIEKARYPSW